MDLDSFKLINDQYGHQWADVALKCFAKGIRKEIRDIDLFSHLSGEEFVLALPSTSSEGAAILAERIRRSVEAEIIQVGNKFIQFTMSCGLTRVKAEYQTVEEIINRAC